MTIEQNEINKIVEKARSSNNKNIKKLEKELEIIENMNAKRREFMSELEYKMKKDAHEEMKKYYENLKEESKREYGVDNNGKIKEDFGWLEEKIKKDSELLEDMNAERKYGVDNNDKIEKDSELLEDMNAERREFMSEYKLKKDAHEEMKKFYENLKEESKRKYGVDNNGKIKEDFGWLEEKIKKDSELLEDMNAKDREFRSKLEYEMTKDIPEEMKKFYENVKEKEEERKRKYGINNNDKIESGFDSLEKKQENELDYKELEDMERKLQQMTRINEERENKEKREIKKNILKNFKELLKKSKDNNYSSDRAGRIK